MVIDDKGGESATKILQLKDCMTKREFAWYWTWTWTKREQD